MTELVAVARDWLAQTGAPNWVVLAALLTSPWTWAKAIRTRLGTLLNKILPAE